jgi:hypothetical protein
MPRAKLAAMTATDRSVIDTHWHGYAELRELLDGQRKLDGRSERVGGTPHAVLLAPEEVAAWVTDQAASFLRQAKVCADVVIAEQCSCVTPRGSTTESTCPNNADGHSFKKDAHGEWRCTHCGALM